MSIGSTDNILMPAHEMFVMDWDLSRDGMEGFFPFLGTRPYRPVQ
jgi:hypothetical protein